MHGLRCGVIGTSNAIFADGYVAGLADVGSVERVDRFALGQSSSLIAPFGLNFLDPARQDFLLIDIAVNECLFVNNGQSALDVASHALEHVCVSALANSCVPVFLIMPSYLVVESPEKEAGVISAIRSIAEKYRAPVFDVYDLLKRVARTREKETIKDFFLDVSHLKREVARNLGRLIAHALTRVQLSSVQKELDVWCHDYQIIPSSIIAKGVPTRRHTTSLIVAETKVISAGVNGIELELEAGERLVGFVSNVAGYACTLEVQGNITWRKSTLTQYADRNGKFFLTVLPLGKPISADGEGVVRINILDVEENGLNEPPLSKGGAVSNVGIELNSVILERPVKSKTVRLMLDSSLDLTRLLSRDEALSLLEIKDD